MGDRKSHKKERKTHEMVVLPMQNSSRGVQTKRSTVSTETQLADKYREKTKELGQVQRQKQGHQIVLPSVTQNHYTSQKPPQPPLRGGGAAADRHEPVSMYENITEIRTTSRDGKRPSPKSGLSKVEDIIKVKEPSTVGRDREKRVTTPQTTRRGMKRNEKIKVKDMFGTGQKDTQNVTDSEEMARDRETQRHRLENATLKDKDRENRDIAGDLSFASESARMNRRSWAKNPGSSQVRMERKEACTQPKRPTVPRQSHGAAQGTSQLQRQLLTHEVVVLPSNTPPAELDTESDYTQLKPIRYTPSTYEQIPNRARQASDEEEESDEEDYVEMGQTNETSDEEDYENVEQIQDSDKYYENVDQDSDSENYENV